MKKKILKYLFPVICVIVVIIAFYMIFDIRNKVDDKLYNTDDISDITNDDDENIVENEVLNENEIENEILNNNIEENKVNNKVDKNTAAVEDDNDEGSTVKKQEAINLVKKEWGEDSSVSYRCETVNSKGEYVIAVIMKSSGSVKAYFNVNLEKKTVEIDY